MTEHELYKLKYPIGEFKKPQQITSQHLKEFIAQIESLPMRLKKTVENLSEEQLNTPYRPQGWTVRQVIHHIPDSHLNSYIRFKWALTEDKPVIKAYFEERWAELADYQNTPIEISLNLLEFLHQRWVILLRSLNTEELAKTFIHPAQGNALHLGETTASYAWHGEHHLAHIEMLKKRMDWI